MDNRHPDPRFATEMFRGGLGGMAQDARSCAEARKSTAAEYTEKRVAESASVLANELDRMEGQYNRLRQHFGIPPEPQQASGLGDPQGSGGMEGQLSRLQGYLNALSGLVSKMNELI